jgi:hypothetical protein
VPKRSVNVARHENLKNGKRLKKWRKDASRKKRPKRTFVNGSFFSIEGIVPYELIDG